MTDEPQKIRVYITMFDVLETGIVEDEADLLGPEVIQTSRGLKLSGFGVLWHRHKASAWRRAGEIRRARVELLLNEIDRLNALDFGASRGGFRG